MRVLAALVCLSLSSCASQSPRSERPSLTSVHDQNKSIASQLGASTETIRKETQDLRPITRETPAAAPHLDSIDAETDKLRSLRADLDKSNAGLDKAKTDCEKLATEN